MSVSGLCLGIRRNMFGELSYFMSILVPVSGLCFDVGKKR